MKKSFITTLAINIAIVMSFNSSSVYGMQYIKRLNEVVEQKGQKAIEYLANSRVWIKICNRLKSLGEEVDSCESYKASTWDQDKDYLKELGLLKDKSELTEEEIKGNNNDSGWVEYNPEGQQKKRIFLGVMCLFAQMLPSSTQINVNDDNDTNSITKFEPFGNGNETYLLPPQSVCFESEHRMPTCCELYPGFNIKCYVQNNPNQSILFNPLDNHDPQKNCCIVNQHRVVVCSWFVCEMPGAIQGPCDLQTGQQNFNSTKSTLSNELVGAIGSLYYDKTIETKEPCSWQPGRFYISKITEFEIPLTLENQPSSMQLLINYLRSIEKKFNINPEYQIKKVFMRHQGAVIKKDNAQIYTSLNDTRLMGVLEYTINFYEMDFVLGHEVAHILQRQLCSNDFHKSIKPGSEISADLLGALAAGYQNLARYSFYVHKYSEFVKSHGNIFDGNTNFCGIQLPQIDRENVPQVPQLLYVSNEKTPHPDYGVRSIMLLKLSTMIEAVVDYLEKLQK